MNCSDPSYPPSATMVTQRITTNVPDDDIVSFFMGDDFSVKSFDLHTTMFDDYPSAKDEYPHHHAAQTEMSKFLDGSTVSSTASSGSSFNIVSSSDNSDSEAYSCKQSSEDSMEFELRDASSTYEGKNNRSASQTYLRADTSIFSSPSIEGMILSVPLKQDKEQTWCPSAEIKRSSSYNFRIKKSKYSFPINSAIQKKADSDVLKTLVQRRPSVLSIPDGNQQEASLLILLRNKPNDVATAHEILEANPKCAFIKDRHFNTPLHIAASYGAALDIVEKLYSIYPDAVTTLNFNGLTPLQLAQRHASTCSHALATFLWQKTHEMSNQDDIPIKMSLSCLHETKKQTRTKGRGNEGLVKFRSIMADVEGDKRDKAKLLSLYRTCRDMYKNKSIRTGFNDSTRNWIRRRVTALKRIERCIEEHHGGSDSSFLCSTVGWIPLNYKCTCCKAK